MWEDHNLLLKGRSLLHTMFPRKRLYSVRGTDSASLLVFNQRIHL